MFVTDESALYLFTGCLALFLFVWALEDTAPSAYSSGTPDYFNYLFRYFVVPGMSFIFWIIFTAMSYSINNCSTIFGACYSNISQTATTAAVSVFNFGYDIGLAGWIMMIVTFLFLCVRIFLFFTQVVGRTYRQTKNVDSKFLGK